MSTTRMATTPATIWTATTPSVATATATVPSAETGTPLERELRWVALDEDTPDYVPVDDAPFPPREAGDLSGLTRSVMLHGVLSPILLRPMGDGLQVVCGHRRYLAARAAGLTSVPAIVAPLADADAIRCFLSENSLTRPLSANLCAELEAEACGSLAEDPASSPGSAGDDLAGAGSGDASPLAAPSRLAARLATSPPGGPAIEPTAGGTCADQEDEEEEEEEEEEDRDEEEDRGLQRLLVRTQAFLDEVRATRAINVPRTEILVDTALELWESGGRFCLPGPLTLESVSLTASHSVLVTFLAAHAGRFLAWDADPFRDLVLGAFLHDVGMVFVPQGSLGEPRSLRQSERSAVQSHTRIGCALIAGAQEWRPEVAEAARDHHERWNGTGYPENRAGAEVGLAARLLGLLDTFGAMITPRPHRDPMDRAFALERLERAMEMGLFDPSLCPVLREALPGCPVEIAVRRPRSPRSARSPLLPPSPRSPQISRSPKNPRSSSERPRAPRSGEFC